MNLASKPYHPFLSGSGMVGGTKEIITVGVKKKEVSRPYVSKNVLRPKYGTIIFTPDSCADISSMSSSTFLKSQAGMADSGSFNIKRAGIHGRAIEIKLLVDAYQQIRSSCHMMESSRFFMVTGPSGSGKSFLFETLREPASRDGAYYVVGKFDQLQHSPSHSAFASCLTDLCDLLVQQNSFPQIKADVNKALGQDAKVLASLITNLPKVTGIEPDDNEAHPDWSKNETFTRLKIACRSFLRAVAKPTSPVVLVLDDLQWSDDSSVDLLQFLLSDKESRHILFVCTYRGHETGAKLSPKLQSLVNHAKSGPSPDEEFQLPTDYITLGCLEVRHISSLLRDLLLVTSTDADPLAKVIYHKTLGLPFHVVQFIELLRSEKLLKYEAGFWDWQVERIQAETDVCDNVASPISTRIRRLPEPLQVFIKIVACIGYSFNKVQAIDVILSMIVPQNQTSMDGQRRNLMEMADLAVNEGLLEKVDASRLKFTHNKVHETAYNLIESSNEAAGMHWHIGLKLMATYKYGDQVDDSLFFLVVEQLNRGAETLEAEVNQEKLAELNCEAGSRARSRNAFHHAAQHFSDGIDLLPSDPWRTCYELTLNLKSSLAEMQGCCSQFEECQHTVNEIIEHATSLDDKMSAYFTQIEVLGSQDNMQEAILVCIKVLSMLGAKIPHKLNLAHVAASLCRTLFSTSRIGNEKILRLPVMSDKRQVFAMKVLGLLSTFAYFCKEGLTLALCSLKMMNLTLKYGLTELSTHAFGSYSLVLSALGKMEQASRFGNLALRLLVRFPTASVPTLVIVHSFAHHWKHRIHESIDPFHDAYVAGVQNGQANFGLIGAFSSVHASFVCGRPLLAIADDASNVAFQAEAHGHTCTQRLTLPLWQTALNLMGEAENSAVLSGEAMNEHLLEREFTRESNDVCLSNLKYFKMVAASYSGDWVSARHLLEWLESQRTIESHFTIFDYTFTAGLITFIAAQRTGKRKYLVEGRKWLKQLQGWLRRGGADCQSMVAILEAEEYVTMKKHGRDELHEKYNFAIWEAHRSNFHNHAAVGHERIATILQERFNDTATARTHLQRAKALYRDWNAMACVERIDSIMQGY